MIRNSIAMALVCACGTAIAGPSALGLYFPFDSNNTAGWTQSMARNDDGSSSNIALPFTFCFYERDENSVFINNNGNLTFGGSFSGFTPSGFPVARPMIAPFWADVDTRNTTGADTNLVWHKFVDLDGDSNMDTLVVTWDAVGVFPSNNSEFNTFQVAISGIRNAFGGPNGLGGLNAMFSYGDMNWTVGTASGGAAATVGINEGQGLLRFDQIGRFDHDGTDYNGPTTPSGVQYLNGRDYFFDACAGIVPAPGAMALLGLGGLVAGRRRR
ncbi:MAG: hypothetical protein JNK25_02475 [Phycisphaerae bacterium]|nr:hypothetical protein [Phycisphaerae bacterium]